MLDILFRTRKTNEPKPDRHKKDLKNQQGTELIKPLGLPGNPFFSRREKSSLLPGEWNVRIERKPHRKRLSVQVLPSGEVVAFARMGTSESLIERFLSENRDWIEKQLAYFAEVRKKYPKVTFSEQDQVSFLGRSRTIRFRYATPVDFQLSDNELLIQMPSSILKLSADRQFALRRRAALSFYKKQAKALMLSRVSYWSARMGLNPTKVTLRAQKSMWGSCSPRNAISLNWKLMAFDLPIIDYVIIHELAHLRHRDHSKSFWALVSRYDSNYKVHRRFLGANQFAVDFLSKKSELYL